MKINSEVNLALIVAVISLISPLLTCAINVVYQLVIRYLDTKERKEKELISSIENIYIGYLSSIGRSCIVRDFDNKTEYGKYFPLILLYIPKEDRKLFLDFDNELRSTSSSLYKGIDNKYSKIIDIIQLEIHNLHTKKQQSKHKLHKWLIVAVLQVCTWAMSLTKHK